jgi:hypothetical protein
LHAIACASSCTKSCLLLTGFWEYEDHIGAVHRKFGA